MDSKLILIPMSKYSKAEVSVAKKEIKKAKKVCYVSLNKTFRSLQEELDKKIAKKVLFIDSITNRIFRQVPKSNGVFIESIEQTNKFAELILTAIRFNQVDLVIFDSVSTLLVYKSDKEVIALFNYIWSFFERMKVNCIIFALKEDQEKNAVKRLGMMVDTLEEFGAAQ